MTRYKNKCTHPGDFITKIMKYKEQQQEGRGVLQLKWKRGKKKKLAQAKKKKNHYNSKLQKSLSSYSHIATKNWLPNFTCRTTKVWDNLHPNQIAQHRPRLHSSWGYKSAKQ